MSKKTIAFAMPAGARGQRDRKPAVIDGATGESVPFPADERTLRDAGSDSKTDAWVRDRPSRDAAGPSAAFAPPPLPGFALGAGVTINLAAERSLMEAMTLSFVVPFALGWFWFAHAMARRQHIWGA